MAPTEIRRRLNAMPFEPFRVHMSDGSHYDVHHPDFMFITQTRIAIGLDPVHDEIPARSVDLDPLHVTRLELLRNGVRRKGRGRTRRG